MGLRLLVLAAILLGCTEAPVLQGVPEGEANRALAALARSGIVAHKTADEGDAPAGAPPGFRVLVPESDVPRAVNALAMEDIPRREQPGFAETFGPRSLVEGVETSRARIGQAISGELARTIGSMDGVLSARVHVALALPPDLGDLTATSRPTASVLIAYTSATPPYDAASIQRLVAGAVDGLRPDDVTVVGARRRMAASTPAPVLDDFMTLRVARDSVGRLRTATAIVLSTVLALLALTLWAVFFRRR